MLNEHSLTVIEGDARIADAHVQQVLGYGRINDLHALIRKHEEELESYRGVFWRSANPPAGSRGGRPTVEGSADQVRAFVLNGGRLSFSFGTIRPIWGEVFAHAMHAVERGRACRCPVMSSATVSGNNVVVAFDSLPPLVIDPTFCKVRPDCGFAVNQGAIAVTGVQQTGQRQIAVSCASNPAGTSIEYAWREQDAQDVVDEWPICTGAIRDAWSVTSLFDPCGKPLVRAALGYQLTL